jgi:hypothetical protein
MKAQITVHIVDGSPMQIHPDDIASRRQSDDRDNPTFIMVRGDRGYKIEETMEELDALIRGAW